MTVPGRPPQLDFTRRYTVEEYLEFEAASPERHEYVDGRIYPVGRPDLCHPRPEGMSGGHPNHDRVVGRIYAELDRQLRGRPCEVFTANVGVRAARAHGQAHYYPDVSALCGTARFETVRGVAALVNPTVLVEVLSPATEGLDRGEKFADYRRIRTLKEYVLVSQDRVLVERFTRAGRRWRYDAFDQPGDGVELPSVGCALRLGVVYERVEFPDDPAPHRPRLIREAAPAYAPG